MDYAGFYINLDRSTERRAAMEVEFAKYGLGEHYSRAPGVEGNALNLPNPHKLGNGELGCFTAHYLALKRNADLGRHLHIVEDDTIFSSQTQAAIEWALRHKRPEDWDIIFLETSVRADNETYKLYRLLHDRLVKRDKTGAIRNVLFTMIDMKSMAYSGLTSYLVNQASIPKLLELYEQGMARGLELPVDLFWRNNGWRQKVKIFSVFPFATSIDIESCLNSLIDETPVDMLSSLTRLLGRHAFFVGCDREKYQEYLKRLPLPPEGDWLADVLSRLLAFTLTETYQMQASDARQT